MLSLERLHTIVYSESDSPAFPAAEMGQCSGKGNVLQGALDQKGYICWGMLDSLITGPLNAQE